VIGSAVEREYHREGRAASWKPSLNMRKEIKSHTSGMSSYIGEQTE